MSIAVVIRIFGPFIKNEVNTKSSDSGSSDP